MGISYRALCLLLQNPTTAFPILALIENCLNDSSYMRQIEIHGVFKSKVAGTPSTEKLRSLLPQAAILSYMNLIVAVELEHVVNIVMPRHPGIYVGGGTRGTQTLDIGSTITLSLEKMIESKSHGGIAQADVYKYYDEIDLLVMINRLVTNCRVPEALVAAAIRLQVDPFTIFHLRDKTFPVGRRTKGVHTGSQTAAILGRIPIEDVARSRAHVWLQHKFDIAPFDGPCFANWCDNVSAFGASQNDAAAIIEDLGLHLRHQWGLRLSDDSKSMILPCHSNRITAELVSKGWRQTE